MTAATAANRTDVAGLCVVTNRKMQMKTAASAERSAAEDQVGFLVSRVTLASSRFCFLTVAALGGLLVRPRLVTCPAAVPRCFVWRLRLVWAMGYLSLRVDGASGQGVFDRL